MSWEHQSPSELRLLLYLGTLKIVSKVKWMKHSGTNAILQLFSAQLLILKIPRNARTFN